MTDALKKAIERIEKMPEERQDMLARLLLHEIEEDERWIQSTEKHADKLRGFVDDVLKTNERDEFESLDPDQL
jgi:ribosomal protein L17